MDQDEITWLLSQLSCSVTILQITFSSDNHLRHKTTTFQANNYLIKLKLNRMVLMVTLLIPIRQVTILNINWDTR
jgi:hypothetical protein